MVEGYDWHGCSSPFSQDQRAQCRLCRRNPLALRSSLDRLDAALPCLSESIHGKRDFGMPTVRVPRSLVFSGGLGQISRIVHQAARRPLRSLWDPVLGIRVGDPEETPCSEPAELRMVDETSAKFDHAEICPSAENGSRVGPVVGLSLVAVMAVDGIGSGN